MMKKAVLYLNQFFGQIGGEDKADYKPEVTEGKIGAALALDKYLNEVEVTHTIICGDNYMGSNQEEAVEYILKELENIEFDIFAAGPAFQAGRYGSACGVICKAVKEKFNVPVITSMHEENPGVDMFRNELIILKGGKSAAAMRKNMKKVAEYINKIVKGQPILSAEEEGYFGRGIRHQVWLENKNTAAERTVEMLINKLTNKPFETELPIPVSEKVEIAKAIDNIKEATIAIVTSGGIVPVDNPDRIQSASATRWGKYNIEGMDRLKAGEFKTIHAGFDPTVANNNPNVITPVDALRQFESEGKIGKLHEYVYSTVGTGTTQAEASRMGREISEHLLEAKVNGVLLVST